MKRKPLEGFSIYIPEELKIELRRLAAKQNLENPKQGPVSAASIARKILTEQIAKLSEVTKNE